MKLLFEMMVFGSDGQRAGWLDRVLVEPTRREVTHVVVRTERVSEEVLLAMSQVQGSADGRLLLHVTSDRLENLPRYYEGRVSSPPAGRVDTAVVREPSRLRSQLDAALNVSPGTVELGPEARAVTACGSDGWLVGLATELPTGRISEVFVGGLGGRIAKIPGAWVAEFRPGAVVLRATSEQLGQLMGI